MDRELLVEYILGTMPEPDRLVLAEQYFADDELYDELLAVETHLLDQYVRGKLDPENRARFEQYLYRLPDSQHRIGVATALKNTLIGEQPAAAPQQDRLHSNRAWQQTSRLVPMYALAMILIVSVVGVGWLLIQNRKLSGENEDLRAKVAELADRQQTLLQSAQTLQAQNSGQQARLGDLQKELEQERERSRRQTEQGRRPQVPRSLVAIELTAASRDTSVPDRVPLTPSTKTVALTIPIEGPKKYTRYRAVVQTIEGTRVWEKPSTQSPRIGTRITLYIKSSQLLPAIYKLTLSLETADGVEISRDYYFIVVKQ